MKEAIEQAYLATCQGYSADRVVVDPDLNGAYLLECKRLGLEQPPASLNKALLNLRKSGHFKGQKHTTKRTTFTDIDSYQFAAEMAARFLERQHQVSLDDILCDLALVAEFDKRASEIAPNFSVLQYRWAALNLRKSKHLQPELLAKVAPPISVMTFKVGYDDLRTAVPNQQGLYLFYSKSGTIYVGESENLRKRIGKHLDHSDNKGFAQWLWQFGMEDLFLEIHLLDAKQAKRIRKALELELIRSRNPMFNIQR